MEKAERISLAESLFIKGYNCAQAVALAFADLTGVDKKIVENLFSANWNDAEEMIKQHISEYATQSAKELLAESYVAYSNGSQDEYVLKVMEYCGIL